MIANVSAAEFNTAAGWLLGGVVLTGVAGLEVAPDDEGDHAFNASLAAVLSRELGNHAAASVEAAYLPVADGPNTAFAGAGLLYRVTPDLQLDAHVDRGLADASTDWLLGAGISFRIQVEEQP